MTEIFSSGLAALSGLKIGSILSGTSHADRTILKEAESEIMRIISGQRPGMFNVPIIIHGKPYPKQAVIFAISGIMLKIAGSITATKRYALGHSIEAEKEIKSNIKSDRKKIGDYIAGAKSNKTECGLLISEYLKRSTHIGDVKWKLVNRVVESGIVYITVDEAVRLLRHDITTEIENIISNMRVTEQTATLLEPQSAKIRATAPIPRKGSSGRLGWPPCVMHAIKFMKDGGNLSHPGRFMLASYLLGAGHGIEKIATYFEGAPDYNQKITTSQIAHIAKSGYSCQSCSKLETLGLCHRNADCKSIRHPSQFKK